MKKSLLALLSALLALTVASPAMALLLPLSYSNVNGSGTYGALELTNISGGVQVAANYSFYTPTAGSFGVQDVYLNLIGGSYTGPIIFTQAGAQNNGGSSWSLVTTAQRADGLGTYTLDATSNGGAGERIPIVASSTGTFTTLFTLTASGLTVDDFLAYSKDNQGNNTQWVAAMHLAGYEANPAGTANTSSFLAASSAVPIPGAVWLLGSGIIGLIGLKRRKTIKG